MTGRYEYQCEDCDGKIHTKHRLKVAVMGGPERCHNCHSEVSA